MKVWYKSKTLWLNVLSISFVVLEATTGVIPYPATFYTVMGVVTPILNAILRLTSNTSITLRAPIKSLKI